MNYNKILADNFLKTMLDQENVREDIKLDHEEIIKRKKVHLDTIINFLNSFVELKVFVDHKSKFDYLAMKKVTEPQLFKFTISDSSKTRFPGISIFIDNPADIEISVNNNIDQEGIYHVNISSNTPHNKLLQGNYVSAESLCTSLAKFLSHFATSNESIYREEYDRIKREEDNNPYSSTGSDNLDDIFSK